MNYRHNVFNVLNSWPLRRLANRGQYHGKKELQLFLNICLIVSIIGQNLKDHVSFYTRCKNVHKSVVQNKLDTFKNFKPFLSQVGKYNEFIEDIYKM